MPMSPLESPDYHIYNEIEEYHKILLIRELRSVIYDNGECTYTQEDKEILKKDVIDFCGLRYDNNNISLTLVDLYYKLENNICDNMDIRKYNLRERYQQLEDIVYFFSDEYRIEEYMENGVDMNRFVRINDTFLENSAINNNTFIGYQAGYITTTGSANNCFYKSNEENSQPPKKQENLLDDDLFKI